MPASHSQWAHPDPPLGHTWQSWGKGPRQSDACWQPLVPESPLPLVPPEPEPLAVPDPLPEELPLEPPEVDPVPAPDPLPEPPLPPELLPLTEPPPSAPVPEPPVDPARLPDEPLPDAVEPLPEPPEDAVLPLEPFVASPFVLASTSGKKAEPPHASVSSAAGTAGLNRQSTLATDTLIQ